jgi:cell wall-associated NlpC family hydrolase
MLLGEALTVYDTHEGWAFVEAQRDGYVGYMKDADIAITDEAPIPTHRVSVRASHLYPEPDFKVMEHAALSFGALVEVTGLANDRFAQTPHGFIPRAHLSCADEIDKDPVTVAELFLGTPYLWGGNSSFGTDCSGLVQMACLACNIPCPGDADMQEEQLGSHLPDDADLKRGDLLFWKGHVAWVAGPDTILHANAFHMAVSYEPLHDALKRIEDQGDGPMTSRKRLEPIS